MGRRKKDKGKTAQQNNSDFTVDKSKQLEAFGEKNLSSITATLTQDIINKFDIKPVRTPAKLGGKKIFPCIEKTYELSLKRAYEIRDEHNEKYKDNPMTLVDYYPQDFGHKAILVSYNIKLDGDVL